VILASHSSGIIRDYCGSAMVLHQGRGVVYPDVEEALGVYDVL